MYASAPLCEHFHFSRTEMFALIRAKGLLNLTGIFARYGRGAGCEQCRSVLSGMLEEQRRQTMAGIFSARGTLGRGPRGRVVGRSQAIRLSPAGHVSGEDFENNRFDIASEAEVTLSRIFETRYEAIRREFPLTFIVTDDAGSESPAQFADVGVVINTLSAEPTFEIYVCGQPGNTARPGQLLLAEVSNLNTAVQMVDRFLAYYVMTADPYTRTAPWCDMLEGGSEHLRDMLVTDKLSICPELEEMLQHLCGFDRREQREAGMARTAWNPESESDLQKSRSVLTQGGAENGLTRSLVSCPPHKDVFLPEEVNQTAGKTSQTQTFTMKVEGADVQPDLSAPQDLTEGSSAALSSSLAAAH
ncbi:nitrite reductase large subunit [Planctomicrobium piriforme]|uniref:Uncharacterized protein n=1 Tax=Planctomicrobium piriforme TaxID=1576369 RepID=A0A1I3DAS1_9PLAN|nr:hypothetical protein [Planctomicrobium piriforme]SFH83591.1 hypothetical protein SAMN05421753_103153 [Planctomicrobium piriforme]